MSTYYYMACDSCKRKTDKIAAVTRLSGKHLDNEKSLLNFLLAHQDCDKLKFFSEYDDERYAYEPQPTKDEK